MPKNPVAPAHPERICWGCDKYCPADQLRCGNGTIRTQHPAELFGDDWDDWSAETEAAAAVPDPSAELPTAVPVDALAGD